MKLLTYLFAMLISLSSWGGDDSFESYLNDMNKLRSAQKDDKALIVYQGKHGELLRAVFNEDRIDGLYKNDGFNLQFSADVLEVYGVVFSDYEIAFHSADGKYDEIYLDGLGVLFAVTYAKAKDAIQERLDDKSDSSKQAFLKNLSKLNITLAKYAPSQVRLQLKDGAYREDFVPVAKARLSKWKKKLHMIDIEL